MSIEEQSGEPVNSPLAIQLMRLGFLILLWLFVYGAVRVGRRAPSYLVVTEGSLRGTRIPLTASPVLIGRADDSTLVLTDDYASTRHARISQQDNVWYVDDLGSTNGTYLGQMRLAGPMPLEPGVPVRIGKTVLELR